MSKVITRSHHPRPRPISNVDVWTLLTSNDIYHLTNVAAGGGTAVEYPQWLTGTPGGLDWYSEGLAAGTNLMMAADPANSANGMGLARSLNDGLTWIVDDTQITVRIEDLLRDVNNPDVCWLLTEDPFTTAEADAIARSIPVADGMLINIAAATGGYTDWFTDTSRIRIWLTTDGGVNWTQGAIEYIGRLAQMQISQEYQPTNTAAMFYTVYPDDDLTVCGRYSPLSDALSDDPNHVGWSFTNFFPMNFTVCDASIIHDYRNLLFHTPFHSVSLAPIHGGTECYVIISTVHMEKTVPYTVDDFSSQIAHWNPDLPVCPLVQFYSWNRAPYIYTAASYVYHANSGLNTSFEHFDNYVLVFGAVDRTDSTILYVLGSFFAAHGSGGSESDNSRLYRIIGGGLIVLLTLGGGHGYGAEVFVTSQNTVLVAVADYPDSYLMRGPNGVSFAQIKPTALLGWWLSGYRVRITEYGGTPGTPGILVMYLNGRGQYLFSKDDGITWEATKVLVPLDYAISNSAR